jgi:hypothetical protein
MVIRLFFYRDFQMAFRLFTFSSETAEPLKIKGFSGCAMGECVGVKI